MERLRLSWLCKSCFYRVKQRSKAMAQFLLLMMSTIFAAFSVSKIHSSSYFSSFQFWILRCFLSLRFRWWRVFFCLKLKCLKKCLVSWCQFNVPIYWNQLYTIPKWIARNWTHFCSMRTFILYQSNFSTECLFSPRAVNRLNRFFNMNYDVKRWHFSFFTANPSSFVCVISSLLQM